MMPVNHVQDAGLLPQSESNSKLTAVDLTATGVTVNKQFLNVTYIPFKLMLNFFGG